MGFEVQMPVKDDGSLSTFGIRAWYVVICLELFKMQFDMVPSFVRL